MNTVPVTAIEIVVVPVIVVAPPLSPQLPEAEELERIEAIAVAAVGGLRDRPVVLVDLVLNFRGDPSESLRVLRVRTDRFDPRGMVEGASTGVEALRQFIEAIVAGSRSDLLPNERAVLGKSFAMFESLIDYHREVLNAEAVAN